MHAFSTQKLSISTTQLVIHGDLNPVAQTSYDIIFRQMQKKCCNWIYQKQIWYEKDVKILNKGVQDNIASNWIEIWCHKIVTKKLWKRNLNDLSKLEKIFYKSDIFCKLFHFQSRFPVPALFPLATLFWVVAISQFFHTFLLIPA